MPVFYYSAKERARRWLQLCCSSLIDWDREAWKLELEAFRGDVFSWLRSMCPKLAPLSPMIRIMQMPRIGE